MNTTKVQKVPPLPYHIRTATAGTVAIYGQPPVNPTSYRVKWPIGRDGDHTIRYGSKIYCDWADALREAKKQADLLESCERPPDPTTWEQLRRAAALYAECVEALHDTGLSVFAAVSLLLELLRHMSVERLKVFAVLYAPRIGKVKDLRVEEIIPDYRVHLFGDSKPSNRDQKRKDACLTGFENRFRGHVIGDLLAGPLKKYLDEMWPSEDPFNKALYCLRGLFNFARDFEKALPAQMATEMDLIVYRSVPKPVKAMVDVRTYARLVAAAYDREIHLVILLVFRLHLRAEECGFPGRKSLEPNDFIRDRTGKIVMIHVRAEVSKTSVFRDIEVEPELREVLGELVPKSGRLFSDDDPFRRVRDLARALGIKWTPRGPRRSCVSHTVCAGEDIMEVARKDGHTVQVLRDKYFIPVEQRTAKLYCAIRGSVARIRTLPRHRRAPAAAKRTTTSEPEIGLLDSEENEI